MHPSLEQGYCKDILAKLATQLDGMTYADLKAYMEGREGTKRHFEATFNKSLLDVLIHAPFDLRTVAGVNRIVRSESSPGDAPAGAGKPERPHRAIPATSLVSRLAMTRHAMLAIPFDTEVDDSQVLEDAMLAVLPATGPVLRSAWMEMTKQRPEVEALGYDLDSTGFGRLFRLAAGELVINGQVRRIEATGGQQEPSYQKA